MGKILTEIANVTEQVQHLAELVQALLNAKGEGIDINQIKNQINQAVAAAVANIMGQLDGLDVTVLRSDVDRVIMNGLAKALLSAGLAHKDIEALTSKYIQHGITELRLRGVQSGCVATPSRANASGIV
jgi:uncharacterized protein YpuA (DUF1002 family)